MFLPTKFPPNRLAHGVCALACVQQPHVWVGVGQRYEVLVVLSPLTASTFFAIAESFQATPKPHQIASLQISADAQPAANVSSTTSRDVEQPAREGQLSVLAANQVDLRSVLKPTGNADDSIDAIAKGYTPGKGLAIDERVATLDFQNATNYTFRITGDNGFMSFNGSGVMIPDPSKLAMRCIGTPQVVSLVAVRLAPFTKHFADQRRTVTIRPTAGSRFSRMPACAVFGWKVCRGCLSTDALTPVSNGNRKFQ